MEAGGAAGRWLAQLVLAQPPGEASLPIREPEVGVRPAGWQIVQVIEREQGVHPLDSETTRYLATTGWARERAAERWAALQRQLLRDAKVELAP